MVNVKMHKLDSLYISVTSICSSVAIFVCVWCIYSVIWSVTGVFITFRVYHVADCCYVSTIVSLGTPISGYSIVYLQFYWSSPAACQSVCCG